MVAGLSPRGASLHLDTIRPLDDCYTGRRSPRLCFIRNRCGYDRTPPRIHHLFDTMGCRIVNDNNFLEFGHCIPGLHFGIHVPGRFRNGSIQRLRTFVRRTFSYEYQEHCDGNIVQSCPRHPVLYTCRYRLSIKQVRALGRNFNRRFVCSIDRNLDMDFS